MSKLEKIYNLRNEALYQANSITDAILRYEEALLNLADTKSLAHAGRLAKYREEITNKKLLAKLRMYFNEIYRLINTNYKDNKFLIIGRTKSLISADDKIIKLLSENMSLDLFRDTYGFRVHLFGNNSDELISKCYSIMNDIIKNFTKKGFTLCEAEAAKDTKGFVPSEHPSVLVPSETGISQDFLYGVKDYIFTPKKNGYQSLHAVFRANTGECFEIQVRTLDMHIYADTGEASHDRFKSERNTCSFDRSKICLPDYQVTQDGKVYDYAGLEEATEIYRRKSL